MKTQAKFLFRTVVSSPCPLVRGCDIPLIVVHVRTARFILLSFVPVLGIITHWRGVSVGISYKSP